MAVKKNLSDLPVLRHYDKLLVVAALVVLLVSLAYLIMAGMARDEERGDSSNVTQKATALKAKPKLVDALIMEPYEKAAKQLADPFQISQVKRDEANFLTPECRVTCMNAACTKPIPEKATVCPFCGLKQEGVGRPDDYCTVGEIPDKVKREKYGLPINDVSVEAQDVDGDGFTLVEEWKAETDPKDPNSHPPYTAKLELRELRGKMLPLRFTAVNKMPDGYQLTFNWTEKRNPRTYWVKENKPIGETGFTAGELNVKSEERDGPTGKIKVDVSTVVIKRNSDGKEIELQIGEKEKNTDVEAIFVFLVDDSERVLLEKQEFKLRDETYRVVSINEKDGDGTVVVEDAGDGTKQKTFKKNP